MQKKLAILVMELFESKTKSYNENTVGVWVKYIMEFVAEKNLTIEAVEKGFREMIFNEDDFISIGKLCEAITFMKGGQIYKEVEHKEPERIEHKGDVKIESKHIDNLTGSLFKGVE